MTTWMSRRLLRSPGARRAIAALGIALLTPLIGCYHYRVSAPQVSNLDDGHSETRWSFFWGLVQARDLDTSCACLNNGLKEATASTNLAYLLLGVASLGIAVPLEVEYVCGKPPPNGAWPNPPRNCPNFVELPAPPDRAPPAPDPALEHDPDAGAF